MSIAWLLTHELIARHAEHTESLARQVGVQLLHRRVLRGQTALGRHVDKQRHFAKHIIKRVSGAVEACDLGFIYRHIWLLANVISSEVWQ